MREEIVVEVEAMSVAEMRKLAPQYGIKSASKFKRPELSKMLEDAMDYFADKQAKEAERKNEEFDLEKLSKKELQDLCKKYKVPSHHNHKSDNREIMIEALRKCVA